jgi:hypothetical protein
MRRNSHEGIEARSHEVVAKAQGINWGRTHPHPLPLSLVPTPCLRACVPSSPPLPPSSSVPNFQTNPPNCAKSLQLHNSAHQGAPSHSIPAKQTHRAPIRSPLRVPRVQNKPTKPRSRLKIEDFAQSRAKTNPPNPPITIPFSRPPQENTRSASDKDNNV